MARFDKPTTPLVQSGTEYERRLSIRAQALFTNLLNLLPSSYISTVQGPNYTMELKAVAVELSRLELALEAVSSDADFRYTRPEFLYQVVGYLVFLNGKLPKTGFDDVEFKAFLLQVLAIYFKGSTPETMRDVVALFVSSDVKVTENFLLFRAGASGLDISDQFGFQVDLDTPLNVFPTEFFTNQANIMQLLDVIRPAHTLYRIRVIFRDSYSPNGDTLGTILDSMRWNLSSYEYDDLRKNFSGIQGVDTLGVKQNQSVLAEDHSEDF